MLLDLAMPGMDGRACFRAMKAQRPGPARRRQLGVLPQRRRPGAARRGRGGLRPEAVPPRRAGARARGGAPPRTLSRPRGPARGPEAGAVRRLGPLTDGRPLSRMRPSVMLDVHPPRPGPPARARRGRPLARAPPPGPLAPRLARGRGDPRAARGGGAVRATRCCSSPAARTRSACCASPRRRSGPARFPFPLLHVDTGHNYPEVIAFRDRRAAELRRAAPGPLRRGLDPRRARWCCATRSSRRNKHQSVTLLDAIAELGFDACIGGARRDEEKARAKERIFSFRDEFGQWDPKNQRPELWSLFNARIRKGENIRAFPISNWTELDVWQYIARERLELPSIYFAHRRARGPPRRRARPGHRGHPAPPGRASSRRSRSASGPSATSPAPRRSSPPPAPSRRSSSRRPRPPSPSAARPASTTRPPTPRWSSARRRGTSSVAANLARAVACRDDGLLRFLTCGSVDDGKSTLIGRLLLDTKSILADALHAIERTSRRRGLDGGGPLAPHRRPAGRARAGDHHRRRLPLLLDRHPQVHHRRRARARAVHPQHGDRGVHRAPRGHPRGRAQGRPHPDAAPLLPRPPRRDPAPRRRGEQDGPRRLVEARFERDPRRLPRRSRRSSGIADVRFIPISALAGDMVVERGDEPPLVRGPTLLEILESAPAAHTGGRGEAPLPGAVGLPAADRSSTTTSAATRAASSRATSRSGTRSRCLPSGRDHARPRDPARRRASLRQAVSEQSVTLLLEDELDVSRGDLLVHAGRGAARDRSASTRRCAGSPRRRSRPSRRYLVRHTTRETKAQVAEIVQRVDLADARAGAGRRASP